MVPGPTAKTPFLLQTPVTLRRSWLSQEKLSVRRVALAFTVPGGVCLEGPTGCHPLPQGRTWDKGGERQEENPGGERNPERAGEGNDPPNGGIGIWITRGVACSAYG